MTMKYAVYIPSKGRHHRRYRIVELCLEVGVRPTLIVEPQDEVGYRDCYGDDVDLLVLKANDQGIPFARNCILDESIRKQEPVWMIDDDITSFVRSIDLGEGYSDLRTVSIDDALSSVEKIFDAERQSRRVILAGMRFRQVLRQHPKRQLTLNRNVSNVVLLNGPDAITRYREDFKLRSDGLFMLDHLINGVSTMIINDLGFSNPTMGASGKGGCSKWYIDGSYLDFIKRSAEVHKDFVWVDQKKSGPQELTVRTDWKLVDAAYEKNRKV